MRIAVDCRMIDRSGIGTFLTGVLSELLTTRRFAFLLIGNTDRIKSKLSELEVAQSAIEYYQFNAPIFSLNELFRYPVHVVNRCDCFFSPNWNIPQGIKIPILSTVHDTLFLDHPEISGRAGTLLRKKWMNWAIRKSHTVLTVSNFSKERLHFHFPSIGKITVCGNGIKNSIKQSIGEQSLPKQEIPYFLYVGNVKPHKGLDTLIEAYGDYRALGGKCKLKIVGEYDNFKSSLKIDHYKIRLDGIEFTGFISDDFFVEIVREAFCLIQPSHYEGFGIPPLEAMYLGTPVVLSDIPVFQELYAGFPVRFFRVGDVKDLLQALCSDHPRIHLTDEQLNRHTYEKVATIISDIIETI